jgi:hypothetical protein
MAIERTGPDVFNWAREQVERSKPIPMLYHIVEYEGTTHHICLMCGGHDVHYPDRSQKRCLVPTIEDRFQALVDEIQRLTHEPESPLSDEEKNALSLQVTETVRRTFMGQPSNGLIDE